jgi:hypothetical protein
MIHNFRSLHWIVLFLSVQKFAQLQSRLLMTTIERKWSLEQEMNCKEFCTAFSSAASLVCSPLKSLVMKMYKMLTIALNSKNWKIWTWIQLQKHFVADHYLCSGAGAPLCHPSHSTVEGMGSLSQWWIPLFKRKTSHNQVNYIVSYQLQESKYDHYDTGMILRFSQQREWRLWPLGCDMASH